MRLYSVTNIFKYVLNKDVNVKFYARWAHRRPAKALTPEEFAQIQKNPEPKSKKESHQVIELTASEAVQQANNYTPKNYYIDKKIEFDNIDVPFDTQILDKETHHHKKKKSKKTNEQMTYASSDVSDVTLDDEGNFVYNKMKNNDPKIASLMLMVKSKKLRNRKSSILLEGKRYIKDALEVGCVLQHLMFTRKRDMEYFKELLPGSGVRLYKMAYRDMQMWSDLSTCPGIMGIFKIPDVTNVALAENSLPLTIICDNIREPGNLGSILRASAAVGCRNVLLTKGCTDIWEPKVLRSAAGAHFRLPIQKDIEWEDMHKYLHENTSVVLADNTVVTSSDNKTSSRTMDVVNSVPLLPYYGLKFSELELLTLVIGGETLGLSDNAYQLAARTKGVRLNIPLDNRVESLNTGTALGIITFEIKRQFLKYRSL